MKNEIKERAQTYGVASLSDYDLAILCGYKGQENELLHSNFAQQILHLAERLKKQKESIKVKLSNSVDVANHFRSFGIGHLPHEEFYVAYVNRQHNIIQTKRIGQGGISGCVVDTKLVLGYALELKASAFVLCHNHPSGNNRPSHQDIELTKKIKEGGLLLDLELLDHIIIAQENYFSFSDNGYFIR